MMPHWGAPAAEETAASTWTPGAPRSGLRMVCWAAGTSTGPGLEKSAIEGAPSPQWVAAPTVVIHGPVWFAVPFASPSLPEAVATKTPAEAAFLKARSTGSL